MVPKDILGLRTTAYKVGNLKKATKWYSKAFSTEPYFNEPFYVGYNIGQIGRIEIQHHHFCQVFLFALRKIEYCSR